MGTVRTSSPTKGLYDSKAFFTHAALLRQAFAHCAKFLAAASRRSLGRISIPVWLDILSDQLPVIGLVGHYPIQLPDRTQAPLPAPFGFGTEALPSALHAVLAPISRGYPPLEDRLLTRYSPICHWNENRSLHSRSTCMHKARRQRLS